MADLTHLAEEICAGGEIYYTGRVGGQYLKTSFLLCDDYVELGSKLFLITNDKDWSDKQSGRFKGFRTVLNDVRDQAVALGLDLAPIDELQERMRQRRDRRNGFFH